MTITSSLNASVSGLHSNASRLASIADNIANSGTAGYKRAVTEFHAMVTTDSGGGTYSAGGVSATAQRLVDESGALRNTTNPTDLAVSGRGFLPLTTEAAVRAKSGDLPLRLATTGSFRADKDGFLKSSAGMILMGWPADAGGDVPNFPRGTTEGLVPVQVNVNQSTGLPTTEMALGLNLPATSTEFTTDPAQAEILPMEYFDNLGRSQKLEFTFTPTLPANAGDPATNQWTMTLRDSDSADAIVGEYTLTFDDTRAFGGTLSTVTVVGGAGGVGDPYDPVTGLISVNVAGGPIQIDLGASLTGSGLTQFSESFAPNLLSKDGSPVGNMTSIEVDATGFIRANFDSGITRVVYQIPLVDVVNRNGLRANAAQTYQPSNDSGSFFLWDAGDGPTGSIVSYAIEESSTDVAAELTSLIQTQRAYSSNAKVIQTVDEMLQETANIKR